MRGEEAAGRLFPNSVFIFRQTAIGLWSLLSVLPNKWREQQPLILGKRASQGLNKYYVNEIQCLEEKLADSDTGMYLNLGMLLPDQIDYKKILSEAFYF